MKSIRNTLNIVLSAIIVALGFGSCVSHRAYQACRTAPIRPPSRKSSNSDCVPTSQRPIVPLSNFHIWGKWGYYNFIIIYNYNYI